jgi:hypothetical protein
MRRRSDHLTFDRKLKAEKARIEAELRKTSPGPRRDLLERKLTQLETAFHMDKWLNCPELQPPK